MRKVTRFLSVLVATFIAISVFSIDSFAMSDVAAAHRRDLTADEITALSTIFDAKWYAASNQDVVKELGEDEQALFTHFVTFGIWEQRTPCKAFNVDAYASRNPDLRYAFGDDIMAYYMHYVNHPKERGSRPGPTLWNALWHNVTVYSVYDFVKGSYYPREGAIPVMAPEWHPGIEI